MYDAHTCVPGSSRIARCVQRCLPGLHAPLWWPYSFLCFKAVIYRLWHRFPALNHGVPPSGVRGRVPSAWVTCAVEPGCAQTTRCFPAQLSVLTRLQSLIPPGHLFSVFYDFSLCGLYSIVRFIPTCLMSSDSVTGCIIAECQVRFG